MIERIWSIFGHFWGMALLLVMMRKMEVYGPPSNPHVPSCPHMFAIFHGEISLRSTNDMGFLWFFPHVDPQTTAPMRPMTSGQDARPALSAKQRALQSLLEMKRSGELQLLAEAGDPRGPHWVWEDLGFLSPSRHLQVVSRLSCYHISLWLL